MSWSWTYDFWSLETIQEHSPCTLIGWHHHGHISLFLGKCGGDGVVTKLCLTLCDPMDCSPTGSFVYGILQARIKSRLTFPFPGDLPNPEIKPTSPALASGFFTTHWATREAQVSVTWWENDNSASQQRHGSWKGIWTAQQKPQTLPFNHQSWLTAHLPISEGNPINLPSVQGWILSIISESSYVLHNQNQKFYLLTISLSITSFPLQCRPSPLFRFQLPNLVSLPSIPHFFQKHSPQSQSSSSKQLWFHVST